jgi:hypothetical protein
MCTAYRTRKRRRAARALDLDPADLYEVLTSDAASLSGPGTTQQVQYAQYGWR